MREGKKKREIEEEGKVHGRVEKSEGREGEK